MPDTSYRSTSRRRIPFLRALLVVGLLVAGGSVVATGWASRPDLNTPRQEVAAALLDGAVVVVGGFGPDRETLASVERWRPEAAAWETLAPLAVAVNHPAAAVVGGRLVVVGGYRGPGLADATDVVQVYDAHADAWRLGAPMPTARGGLAAVAFEGRLLAIGGGRDGVSLADVAAYDPVRDAWEVWPPLGQARDHLGAAVLDGRVHVLGGRAAGDFALATHEVFDPVTDAWSAAPELPTGRSGHAVAVVGDCLYAFGGEGNVAERDGLFDQVERFVGSTGTWASLAPMPVPRHGMAAVAVDGPIVLPGGATLAGYAASAHVDAYEPPACR